MIMAFTIDVEIAVIFVIAVPLISLVIYLIMKWTVPIYKRVQSSGSDFPENPGKSCGRQSGTGIWTSGGGKTGV